MSPSTDLPSPNTYRASSDWLAGEAEAGQSPSNLPLVTVAPPSPSPDLPLNTFVVDDDK